MKRNTFWTMRFFNRSMLLATSLAASSVVWAQGAIENISGAMQGGVEIVRIDFSEPVSALPTGFVTQSPARIALDFPDTTSGLGKSVVQINQGNIRSANLVQAPGRSRVVLNLKQAASYRTELQGKSVLVYLDTTMAPVVATNGSQTAIFSESANAEIMPIKDIDFRRGADGSGRVVITLPNNQVGVDLRPVGKGLTVDFLKSSHLGKIHRPLLTYKTT